MPSEIVKSLTNQRYQPIRQAPRCAICNSPAIETIDGMKQSKKYTNKTIFEFCKRQGLTISQQWLQTHFKNHSLLTRKNFKKPKVLSRETMELVDTVLDSPSDVADYALKIVSGKIKNGELTPRTWRDGMETIKVAKDVSQGSEAKFYLSQLIQINNIGKEEEDD